MIEDFGMTATLDDPQFESRAAMSERQAMDKSLEIMLCGIAVLQSDVSPTARGNTQIV